MTIDGKLYHVSKNGYAIDRYAKGLHEIDGGMYYVKEDGSFLTNSAVEYLTFDANGRYTSGNATLDSYVDQALAACAHTLPVRIRQEAQRLGQKRALCSCLNTKRATATALQASSFIWPGGWATMPM